MEEDCEKDCIQVFCYKRWRATTFKSICNILEEDKEDLRELKRKYISTKSEDDKASLEEEIIDSIFFLEDAITDGV